MTACYRRTYKTASLVAVATLLACSVVNAQEERPDTRTISFVMTTLVPAGYYTKDGKEECPKGLNSGPREQFPLLYPAKGKTRTAVDTQLSYEGDTWLPLASNPAYEAIPWHEPRAKVIPGFNLDGRVDADDYVGPDGEKGVDNQLYRAVGCVGNFRAPDGMFYFHRNRYMRVREFNRVLLEVKEVDDLKNDDSITVNLYRGYDALLTDATGMHVYPYSTHRIDDRWGKQIQRTFKAKIVDGVLTTQPGEAAIPWMIHDNPSLHYISDFRIRLKLTEDGAEGVWGGYTDIESFYYAVNQSFSTHHLSYGQGSSPSLFITLHKLADGPPNAAGERTSISSAFNVTFARAFIVHPQPSQRLSRASD